MWGAVTATSDPASGAQHQVIEQFVRECNQNYKTYGYMKSKIHEKLCFLLNFNTGAVKK